MDKKQYFHMEFKEVEVKEGVIKIKGLASTPDIDRYDDIVVPKAFKSSIEQYMSNPVILLQHDGDKVIGKATDYKITKKGLEVTVEIMNNLENVMENINNKLLGAFSIGFIPKQWNYKEEGNKVIREITDLDLIEISVVSTPANANALFTLSKSIKSFFDKMDKDKNLITNSNNMEEVKTVEEVIADGAVAEDVTTEEVVIDGTNPDKVLDGAENEGENPSDTEESKEVETVKEEAAQVAEETITEEIPEEKSVNGEDKEEVGELKKEIESMKQEMKGLKLELTEAKDFMLLNIKTIAEITGQLNKSVNSIPVRKGMIAFGSTEKSVLGQQLEAIQKSIL